MVNERKKIEQIRQHIKLCIMCVFLVVVAFIYWKTSDVDVLYLDNIPTGYQIQNNVPFVRYALPESVTENMIELNSTAVDEETLKKTINSTYVCRDENYGSMIVGPDLLFLTARDKELFSMDLSQVNHGDEIRFILKNEVHVDGKIRVKDTVRKVIDESGVVKLIAPIIVSDLTFSSIKLEDSYAGYVSMIQNNDSISGIFISTYPSSISISDRKIYDKVCKTIAQSFQLDSTDANHSTYGNVIPEFSYESGGLLTYDGYDYKNLGTEKMDTHGTYNQIDSMVGMYCAETGFGPINMPYILNDKNLSSSIIEKDSNLEANIHSESELLKYDIQTKSIKEGQTFEDIMSELRGKCQSDYSYFMDVCNYTKKSVLSEQVDKGSGAVITVCGWNETTGQMTVVYYKLEVTKDLYTITRIENNQRITDDTDPLLRRIVELSGIVIVSN